MRWPVKALHTHRQPCSVVRIKLLDGSIRLASSSGLSNLDGERLLRSDRWRRRGEIVETLHFFANLPGPFSGPRQEGQPRQVFSRRFIAARAAANRSHQEMSVNIPVVVTQQLFAQSLR